ncbi:unnamed protein product, partial [Ectocarpus sp. 13 AM-2016]
SVYSVCDDSYFYARFSRLLLHKSQSTLKMLGDKPARSSWSTFKACTSSSSLFLPQTCTSLDAHDRLNLGELQSWAHERLARHCVAAAETLHWQTKVHHNSN